MDVHPSPLFPWKVSEITMKQENMAAIVNASPCIYTLTYTASLWACDYTCKSSKHKTHTHCSQGHLTHTFMQIDTEVIIYVNISSFTDNNSRAHWDILCFMVCISHIRLYVVRIVQVVRPCLYFRIWAMYSWENTSPLFVFLVLYNRLSVL